MSGASVGSSFEIWAPRDQPLLLGSILFRIADSAQQCPRVGKEGAQPFNDQALQVAGGDPPPLRVILGGPRDQ